MKQLYIVENTTGLLHLEITPEIVDIPRNPNRTYMATIGANFTKQHWFTLISEADEIVYNPLSPYELPIESMQFFINSMLVYAKHVLKKPVTGNSDYVADQVDPLLFIGFDYWPRQDRNILWVAGCSYAHGSMLPRYKEQRYGEIMRQRLKMPAVFRVRPGSSIVWAGYQLLQSEIQKDDIVVWGITGAGRYTYYEDKQLYSLTGSAGEATAWSDAFFEKQYYYHQTTQSVVYDSWHVIDAVVKRCRAVGAKLVMTMFDLSTTEHEAILFRYLSQYPEFFAMYDFNRPRYVDYADDNMHPGPEQHKIYAQRFLEEIDKRYGTQT